MSGGYSIPRVRECFALDFLFYSTSLLLCCASSKVFPFLPSHEVSVSNLVGVALARCQAAGLSPSLPETLPDFIFRNYESLVVSVPWNQQSATVNLKQICATLTVRTSCGLL